jgi:hypothetical protein
MTTVSDRIAALTSNHYESVVLRNADLVYIVLHSIQDIDWNKWYNVKCHEEINPSTYEFDSALILASVITKTHVKLANKQNEHMWNRGHLYVVNYEKADEFEQYAMLVCLKYGCELEKIDVAEQEYA